MTELTNERAVVARCEADQASFEAWARSHGGLPLDRAGDHLKTDDGLLHFPTYKFWRTEIAWRAWANKPDRATPSSECALPPGERIAIMTGESCYTAEQVEQIRREAVEADRRGRANSPEFEGIKTHLASAAQGVKTLPEDLLDELNDAVIEALNQAFAMKDWGARDHWRDILTRFEDWRAAPPLSSEPQLANLDNAGAHLANSASQVSGALSSEQQDRPRLSHDGERYRLVRAQLSRRDFNYLELEGEPESELDAYCDAELAKKGSSDD